MTFSSSCPCPPKIKINNIYDNDTILYGYYNYSNQKNIVINGTPTNSSMIFEIFKNKHDDFGDIVFENNIDLSDFTFYTLDINKLNNLFNETFDCKVDYNTITSTINLDSNKTIMLPFINIDGYNVYVNGEKTEFSNKFEGFMTLDLQAGENVVEIKFNNPYLTPFLLGIIVGILIVLIALIINKYVNKFNDKLINTSFNIFSCSYIYFTILIPIVIMLLKILNII